MTIHTQPAHAFAAATSLEIYRSTKTYDHTEGLSCCFRQWRATHSHCRLVHGYALAFKFVFATYELDERNWCFDFGGLKPIRAWLGRVPGRGVGAPVLGRVRGLVRRPRRAT